MSFFNLVLGDQRCRELLAKAERFAETSQIACEWYFEKAFRLRFIPASVTKAAEIDDLIREYLPEETRAEIESMFAELVNRVFDISDAFLSKLEDYILNEVDKEAEQITQKALIKVVKSH